VRGGTTNEGNHRDQGTSKRVLVHPGRHEEEKERIHRKGKGMQNLKTKKGQGLVEYILVVFLMAILAIVAVRQLGQTTQTGFNKASTKLNSAFQ
jgi:hypothetical protein